MLVCCLGVMFPHSHPFSTNSILEVVKVFKSYTGTHIHGSPETPIAKVYFGSRLMGHTSIGSNPTSQVTLLRSTSPLSSVVSSAIVHDWPR